MECETCGRRLQDDARFCSGCRERVSNETHTLNDQEWAKFIGPHSNYYVRQFERFHRTDGKDGFAFTWNWPAFLFDWIWFLYRKMYLYAGVFFIGPIVTLWIIQGDVTGYVILTDRILFEALGWKAAAGLSANYLYYTYGKRTIDELHRRPQIPGETRDRTLSTQGGVQPYVVWLGVGMVFLFLLSIVSGVMNPSQDTPGLHQSEFEDV